MTTRSRRLPLRLLAAATALAGALSLAGCGNDDTSARSATPSPSSSPAPRARDLRSGVAGTNALVNAAKLVIDKVPGSTLTSIETDQRGWQVRVSTSDGLEQKAQVNPAGNRIRSGPRRQGGVDRAKQHRLVAGATVDYAVAVRIIARLVPGGIDDFSLSRYRDQVVWRADDDSRPKVSVRVNAGDGRVLTRRTGRTGRAGS